MNPPRLARTILRRLLPPADRAVILGDVDEEYGERQRTAPAGAYAWYWLQVGSAVPLAIRRRIMPTLTELPADVRYTWRTWRRSPAFASAAILTQAVGISVATAILAVAYAVLVQPLPYRDAGRIVQIFEGTSRPGLFSWQDFLELRAATRSFEAVAGFSGGSRTLSVPGLAPERIATAEVTGAFFDVLGVVPAAGRDFVEDDTKRGAEPVVILSHASWTRRFAAAPAAVGGSVLLNGTAHTIIGVLPRDFEFPLRGQAEFWLPLRPSQAQEERGYWHWLDVIGRLRADVSAGSVDGDLAAIASGFGVRDSKFHGTTLLRTQPLRDVIVGDVRPTIYALLAGVALVLVATCATMAGLLLSRAGARLRELSVRAAVGAGRGRLVRQLVTENVLLAVAGGAAGLLGGRWLLGAFAAMIPAGQRAALPHVQEISLQPWTIVAVGALTLLTGLLFGVWPALRTSRGESSAVLKGIRSTATRREGRLRFALVSLQVAVAFVLLTGAALLGTSVYRLLQKDPGFDPQGLVTMRLTLSGTRYADDGAVAAFHRRLEEALSGIPGVTGVAVVSQAPLTGRGDTGSPAVAGVSSAADTSPDVGLRTVSPGYFDTLGIPLVRGRAFDDRATPAAAGAVLVNQLLAERLFGTSDPIGNRLTFAFAPGPWDIIGVVGNEQLDDLDKPLLPVVYFSSRQDAMRSLTIMLRGAQPEALAGAARGAIAELDPALPVFGVRTIEQLTMNSVAVFMRRAAMWLLGVFAAAAVLLAAVALYGVLTQAVSERTREIGVRMALGASRGAVFGLVLRGGATAIALGILIGLGGTLVVSQMLRSLLFGVSSTDPLVLASCAAVLGAASLLACAGPLWRAVRISPATALRGD